MKLSLAVASAALVLAGCTKKPARPAPDQTLIGQTPGGQNINSSVVDAPFKDLPAGLVDRGAGFDPNGQNRTALQSSTVYFEFNASAIRPAEREKLKAVKAYLEKNPTHRILLEGHCDWRGTAEYNLSLGERRASATKKYLQSIGVSADKLETLSKGSLEASKNADDATMEKDRRVDVVVIDAAGAAVKPL